MRNTRDWLRVLPLATLTLHVTGSLTAQTRYLAAVAATPDAVVANGAQNALFGLVSNTTTGLLETHSWDGAAWTLVTATGPAARSGQAMAGAPGGGVVMIGGVPTTATPVNNATNHFDGTTWTTIAVTSSPSLRSGAGCAQLGNGNVVLFGGSDVGSSTVLADTWIFNGSNWTNLAIAGPGARVFMAMGSDGNGNVLLFGGLDATGALLNDTWRFNGTTWTQLFPAAAPTARFGAALAPDPKVALSGVANRTSVVLAGGLDFTIGLLTDVWVFAAGNWTLQPFVAPASVGFATAAFDGAHREVVFAENTAFAPFVVGEFGFTNYGSGCPCSSGVPAMVPSGVTPQIGNTTSWNVTGGVPGGFVFLVVDFAPANIPWSTSCTQWVGSGGSTVGFGLNGVGAGAVPFAIPNSPSFIGGTLFGQVIDVVNFCGSDAIEMRVGR